MSEDRPLLPFGGFEGGGRFKQQPSIPPRVSGPGAGRQGTRLAPQFQALQEAFGARRAQLVQDGVTEVDPALVLVFDLVGSVQAFGNAINHVPGLEFLTELLDDDVEPDDDFQMVDVDGSVKDGTTMSRSLYLVMTNAEAAGQLVRLFELWSADPTVKLDHGLGKFKIAFEQLRAIRPWGPQDRIRETGLLDAWRDSVQAAGQYVSTVLTEVELWYRSSSADRATAEEHIRSVIAQSGGQVRTRADIPSIKYHAVLAELPVQQVHAVLGHGADSIGLLTTDEVMLVSPFTPMSVKVDDSHDESGSPVVAPGGTADGLPRVALLDGLPFVNHDLLAGRLVVDDPDGYGDDYPASGRRHGTAMASLIVHGDLSAPGAPLGRPLYVRPILRPHEFAVGVEQTPSGELLTDLLHRAIVRIAQGEGAHPPVAPSVRVVNLSLGVPARALVRRMSPLGRLLDWLSVELNLLFIVSAGNHPGSVRLPSGVTDVGGMRLEALRHAHHTSRIRGILPPGDSLNALTVGALHHDASSPAVDADTVVDVTLPGMPALYGGSGPGVGRSIKPEILHSGGRALYTRPVAAPGEKSVALLPASTSGTGPGIRVAAPGRMGDTSATAFDHGTSDATALVTREASHLFDVLESASVSGDDGPLADPEFHPVLVKALLVHATGWGGRKAPLQQALGWDDREARRQATTALGYGALDLERLGRAATNRAVLVAGARIGGDGRHTYEVPLPPSLRSKAVWHQITVTLAYFAPTDAGLSRYRAAKVFFEFPDKSITGGARTEAEHYAVRRGTCQHEVISGHQAMTFGDRGILPIHVECMDDARHLSKGKSIRYGLVVSIEAKADTSVTIHDEVRDQLRQTARARGRQRLSGT